MLDVDPVAAGQDLVDHDPRLGPLDVEHAAVAGGGRGARQPRAARQRGLGVARQGPVAHPGDHQRDVELDRLRGEPGAQHGPRAARLAIAFQRDAREGAGDERQVVEGRPGPRPEDAEAADAIPGQLGLDLDVLDHAGRERCPNVSRGEGSPPMRSAVSVAGRCGRPGPESDGAVDSAAGHRSNRPVSRCREPERPRASRPSDVVLGLGLGHAADRSSRRLAPSVAERLGGRCGWPSTWRR